MNAPAAGYSLGVDLGTTFTAAAVHRDGRLQMVSLGNRSMVVPSVLFQKDDGELLVGEAAETRAESAPGRVAREFKRRMGDPAPLLLGGTPHSPEALTGRLLRWVVDKVSELEGAPPRSIALTHPANWKTFKIDVLRQAYEMAGLAATPVTFLSEPEAASLAYAADERPPPRSRIAVYDLGGGTFDASVLENRGDRFMILGDPGGIERLGGIDFDDALFHFVRSQVPGIDDVDVEDPDVLADLLDLRRRCVEAKEALSADLDTSVTARLGAARHEIRVLRKEFEDLIRPTLRYTTEALARTIEAAGLTAADLHTVLLVGGSSRVPLVGETVSAQMGRPVAVDIHPKHSVALGAALVAAGASPSELLPGGAPVVGPDDDPHTETIEKPPAQSAPPAERATPVEPAPPVEPASRAEPGASGPDVPLAGGHSGARRTPPKLPPPPIRPVRPLGRDAPTRPAAERAGAPAPSDQPGPAADQATQLFQPPNAGDAGRSPRPPVGPDRPPTGPDRPPTGDAAPTGPDYRASGPAPTPGPAPSPGRDQPTVVATSRNLVPGQADQHTIVAPPQGRPRAVTPPRPNRPDVVVPPPDQRHGAGTGQPGSGDRAGTAASLIGTASQGSDASSVEHSNVEEPTDDETKTRWPAILAGAFLGVLIFLGIMLVVTRARASDGQTETGDGTESSVAATASSGARGTSSSTSAPSNASSTTVVNEAADTVRDWLLFVSDQNFAELKANGGEASAIQAECASFLADAEADFGPLPTDPAAPQVPQRLSTVGPSLPEVIRTNLVTHADGVIRRARFCAAGDFENANALAPTIRQASKAIVDNGDLISLGPSATTSSTAG